MKTNKFIFLLFLSLISTLTSFSQSKTFDNAIDYNDYIIGLQNEIGVEIQAFISAVTNGDKSDALLKLKNLTDVIELKITDISNLEGFEGNTKFRDAGLALFKFYKSIAQNEYKEFVEVKFKENMQDEDYERLQQIVQQISDKEKTLDEEFLGAQQDFADLYGFELNFESNELPNGDNETEDEAVEYVAPKVQAGMPSDAEKVLENFLNFMINGDQDGMKNLISPAYKKKNKTEKSKYRVNNYGLVGFHIFKFDEYTSTFTCHIWGNNKSWIHELTFKMVKEKGKWFIYPSSFDGEWMDPWANVTAYVSTEEVEETKQTKYTEPTVQKDIPAEINKIVSDFLEAMIKQNQDAMKLLISPAYKTNNNTEAESYRVNNYGLTGYIIFKFDRNTNIVTVHIWGNSKNWVHELTFTLNKENGNWYIVPSKFDGEWLDPWTQVTPYVNE